MKLKRFLMSMTALCFLAAVMFPLHGQAASGESATAITAKVPQTHTVWLDIGEHGAVMINGRAYTSKDKAVSVERLNEQTYTIQADQGWQAALVSYGPADEKTKVELTENAFTAPAVSSDNNVLTVTFEEIASGAGESGTTRPDAHQKGESAQVNVKTGDQSRIAEAFLLLLLSGAALLIVKNRYAKRG